MKKRCSWVSKDKLYIDYHDNEWGKPNFDDYVFFEFLVLESAQAGLSWITILKRREQYRKAYDGFDFHKVMFYDEEKINELMNNSGIIRNKRKICSSITNANAFVEVRKEFGSFSNYIWSFTNGNVIRNRIDMSSIVSSELSDTITKDMKKRGFSFIGTKIIYSFLQANGIVNDHEKDCFLSHS